MFGSPAAGGIPGIGHNGGPHLLSDAFMQDAVTLGFVQSEANRVEEEVYRVRYPGVQYPELVPVDTSANEWTATVSYYSSDSVGRAAWFHGRAQDVPLIASSRQRFETGVAMAALGYDWTIEEVARARAYGMNLDGDRARDAREFAEMFIDDVAMRGDASKGYSGLINAPTVSAGSVAANGTGSTTLWANKTPDQILADVNNGLMGVYTGTRQIEVADTILVPIDTFAMLGARRLADTSEVTLLSWIQRSNALTALTGQPITIRAVRGLETAGSANSGRMVVYRRDPAVLKFHMPMPFRFLPVMRQGPILYEVPGIMRLGGVDVRRPSAMRYLDGIM